MGIKVNKLSLACAVALSAAASNVAAEVAVEFNVDVVSDYLLEGISLTDGNFAVQPSVTAFYGDFYVGAWASNVDMGTADNFEYDLYVGYYKELGNGLYVNTYYARYYFDDSGFDSAALIAAVGGPLSEKLWGELQVTRNFDYEATTPQLTLGYNATDELALKAVVGDSELTDVTYWSVGGSYALSDTASLDLSYNGLSNTSVDEAGVVATFSVSF